MKTKLVNQNPVLIVPEREFLGVFFFVYALYTRL